MIQDMALLKPAHVGREKPWHQDTAYFVMEPIDLVLGTWIALDAATPENGCMHVIPGSHRGGPRPHYHDRDCQLPDEAVEVDRDVMVPLRAGGRAAVQRTVAPRHAAQPIAGPAAGAAVPLCLGQLPPDRRRAATPSTFPTAGAMRPAPWPTRALPYRPIAEQG